MEHFSQYQTIINNIHINNDRPSVTSSIQSALTKTNCKLKRLTRLLFSEEISETLLFEYESANLKPKEPIIKNTLRKKRPIQLYLNDKLKEASPDFNISSREQTPRLPIYPTFHHTTRNKYNPYLSCLNKTNSHSFNHNQTTLTKSTTITQKKSKFPKLCLFLQNGKVAQKNLAQNSINSSTEAFKTSFNSPNPFSLQDTNMNKTISQSKDISYSSKRMNKQCALIENSCHSVDRRVKKYLSKLKKKKTIDQLLNNSHDTVNDLTDSKPVKVYKEYMIKVFGKNNQIIRESEWIHRINPNITLNSNKTLKNMFSIRPHHKSKEELQVVKLKTKFERNINQIAELVNKNLKANKKYSEYLTKIHFKQKPKPNLKDISKSINDNKY